MEAKIAALDLDLPYTIGRHWRTIMDQERFEDWERLQIRQAVWRSIPLAIVKLQLVLLECCRRFHYFCPKVSGLPRKPGTLLAESCWRYHFAKLPCQLPGPPSAISSTATGQVWFIVLETQMEKENDTCRVEPQNFLSHLWDVLFEQVWSTKPTMIGLSSTASGYETAGPPNVPSR